MYIDENEEKLRRADALEILEGMCRHNRAITADMLYATLEYAEYSEDERMRLLGGLIRSASSYGWIRKTFVSVRSLRNSSNCGSLWHSNIYGRQSNGRGISEDVLDREHAKWEAAGMLPLEIQKHYGMWLEAIGEDDHPYARVTPHETY